MFICCISLVSYFMCDGFLLYFVLLFVLLYRLFAFFYFFFFFFKQKTAYEMRISDWSSDVCSSDLIAIRVPSKVIIPTIVPRLGHEYPTDIERVRRSEERRVGKECVSTCRSRWSPYH